MGKSGLILVMQRLNIVSILILWQKMGLLELVFFSCSKNTMYNLVFLFCHLSELKRITVIHFGVFWIQATRCRSTPSIKSLKTA